MEVFDDRFHRLFFEAGVAIVAADNLAHCDAVFANAVATCGVNAYSTGEVFLSAPERSMMHIVHWPDSWRKFYFANLAGHDPVVEALRRRRRPFTWGELRNDRSITLAGTEALRVIAEHGWTDGLVVPIVRSDDQIGIVSLVGTRGPFGEAEIVYLSTLSFLFHERVRLLTPACGVAVPPSGMTEREIEALGPVARGGTDADVARALNVSVTTAHDFVEKAKRRLKASTRTQAAVLAVSLGLLSA